MHNRIFRVYPLAGVGDPPYNVEDDGGGGECEDDGGQGEEQHPLVPGHWARVTHRLPPRHRPTRRGGQLFSLYSTLTTLLQHTHNTLVVLEPF